MTTGDEAALGERIRAARLAAGLTQPDLAQRIGLKHPQSISNYERGVSDPGAARLRQIAEATGKPLTFFYVEAGATAEEITELREELAAVRGEIAQLSQDFGDLRELLLARARAHGEGQ